MTLTLDKAIAELRQSAKFLTWHLPRPASRDNRAKTEKAKSASPFGRARDFTYIGESYTNLAIDEKHFTPAELAKTWGVSAETIRAMFREEPGVLKIGENGTRHKRGYKTLRIPQSVAERVHTRLSA